MTVAQPEVDDDRWTVDTDRHFVGMSCSVERPDSDDEESGVIAAIWSFRGERDSHRRRTRRRRGREHGERTCQLRLMCLTHAPSFKPRRADIYHSQDRSTSTRTATRLRTRNGGTSPCSAAGYLKLSPTESGGSTQRISRRRRRAARLPSPTDVDTIEPLAGQSNEEPLLSEVPAHV